MHCHRCICPSVQAPLPLFRRSCPANQLSCSAILVTYVIFAVSNDYNQQIAGRHWITAVSTVPADGIDAVSERNGDFGTSPFYRQLLSLNSLLNLAALGSRGNEFLEPVGLLNASDHLTGPPSKAIRRNSERASIQITRTITGDSGR